MGKQDWMMDRIPIPDYPGDITPEWLTRVLQRSGAITGDTQVRCLSFSDPGRESSYAGYVSRLTLEYDREINAGPRTMIAKLPAPERLIRLLFRSIYRNETLFYRQLADSVRIPVPACYAALINRRRTRSFLLLEDLSDIATPGDHETGCTTNQASLALTRLANLHAAWWNSPSLDEISWLGRYEVNSRKNWLIYAGAWGPFQYRLRHVTPPATLRLYRSLWRSRETLQRLEAGRPRTLQHGDFRLANLAFGSDEVYAFDWQVIRSGPPLFDVAWFMITSLTIEQRRLAEETLLSTYHCALADAGVTDFTMEDLLADYRLALLMTIPQIMVIGAFLRIDERREAELKKLLQRFDALRVDHQLEHLL
jgi:thiamine kinase-like enzyme